MNAGVQVRVDLYFYNNQKLTIYEGKKKSTQPQDVYHLVMYWDGCVMDNRVPDIGILIASEHPESVKTIVEAVNQTKDLKGNNYNIILKTWADEGVPVDLKKNNKIIISEDD